LDRACARRVTHFVAISEFVARRIQGVYGRGARVVYPPVSVRMQPDRASRREEFLLYLGRLVPYKRVDLLIGAARQMGIRTVIAGDGPDRHRLTQMAGPTVEFLGNVSDAGAAELLGTCAAFVFGGEEDFGIAPLEANAHGAPVVAYKGGAISETMQDGVTAVLYHQPTVQSLSAAIRQALSRSWNTAALRGNAERFSVARFRESFSGVVNSAVKGDRW